MEEVKTGSITGTGANIDTNIGFKPSYVHLMNITSGDELFWVDSMADGYGFKRIAAGTGAQITSGGITPLDDGTTYGFRLGTDSDMNVLAEVIRYVAVR